MTLYVYFIDEHSSHKYPSKIKKKESEEFFVYCETNKSINLLKYSIDPCYHLQTRFDNIFNDVIWGYSKKRERWREGERMMK